MTPCGRSGWKVSQEFPSLSELMRHQCNGIEPVYNTQGRLTGYVRAPGYEVKLVVPTPQLQQWANPWDCWVMNDISPSVQWALGYAREPPIDPFDDFYG